MIKIHYTPTRCYEAVSFQHNENNHSQNRKTNWKQCDAWPEIDYLLVFCYQKSSALPIPWENVRT